MTQYINFFFKKNRTFGCYHKGISKSKGEWKCTCRPKKISTRIFMDQNVDEGYF